MGLLEGSHIVIILEDMPIPLDTRVWQEARSLKNAGADVSIISPKSKVYNMRFENLDGINIHRHPLPFEAKRAHGFLMEYGIALFFQFILLIKIYFRKRFHVIQGCTPPDLIFVPALPFKLFGVKYIYDHHDLNPELYLAKFNKKNFIYRLLLFIERQNFRFADYSIAMNESYKKVAVARGKMDEDKVVIIRSGPDLNRIKLQPGNPVHKHSKKFLVGYLGVISEQDCLDVFVRVVNLISNLRKDVHFAVVGGGPDLSRIKEMAKELHVENCITFYGMLTNNLLLLEILNTFDVCVNTDLSNDYNDRGTTLKLMEYMAAKKPVVQFDLKEGKYSAGEASLYAENNNETDFAEKIIYLLDNPELRKRMGELGYKRITEELAWQHEEKKYIKLFQTLAEPKISE